MGGWWGSSHAGRATPYVYWWSAYNGSSRWASSTGNGDDGLAPGLGVPGGMGFGGMPPFQRTLNPVPTHPNAKLRGGEEDEMKTWSYFLTKSPTKNCSSQRLGRSFWNLYTDQLQRKQLSLQSLRQKAVLLLRNTALLVLKKTVVFIDVSS